MSQGNKIPTYINKKQIKSITQLPVPLQQRSSTDICCTIMTAIFALAMFVTACIFLNTEKLGFITYPTDQMGRKCTQDTPKFNYLYFTSARDPSKRLCVSECPVGSEDKLKCLPTDDLGCAKNNNPNYEVQIYPSTATETSIGLYCFPLDESLKNQILQNSNLVQRFDFIKSYRSIWISAGVAFGLGLLFLLLNCCITRSMVYVSIVLGGLCFLGSAILLIVQNSKSFHSYSPFLFILAAIFIIFSIMLLSSLCFKSADISLCGQFLEKGVHVLKKQKILLLLIPIFIALTAGLIVLCVFQLLAYWSSSDLVFNNKDVFYSPHGTFAFLMQFLDLLQFLWGLCFLKQIYNFIVSGCAVTFYFLKDSYIMHGIKGLFRYHWGSVVAGSFLLNFFYLIDIIYYFFRSKPTNKTSICCCCDRVFGFARSETMAFINSVGLPYCNSSRWCEKINYMSSYFDGGQSIFRYFSLGSHVLLATSATAIGFLYSTATGSNPKQLALLFSFALNLFIITYFVSLFKNLAESILMCTLIEKYLKGEDMYSDQNGNAEVVHSKPSGAKNIQESNVEEGYEVLPTNPY